MFSAIKKVHFVGIGGIGMSGIAEILLNQGFDVSGSDIKESDNTQSIREKGAEVFIGHHSKNVHDKECVVYSSAVKLSENPETKEAQKLGIPVIRRAEMLAEVSRLNYSIAISGTHGKTTTTSLTGLISIEAGLDPTVIVGGRLSDFGGSNARLGHGEWTVLEADEYDRSFLQLSPTIAVINNIEPEHLDIYNDFDDIKSSFTEFANKTPFYGLVSIGIDNPGAREILKALNKKVVTFGFSRIADYRAEKIELLNGKTDFDLVEFGEIKGRISLNLPGEHNVLNALAAISVARQMGINIGTITAALEKFKGIFRRFDICGKYNGSMVVDDYAHHPTEVRATLAAARKGWNRRVIAIFQPHTFTRTRDFYDDFGRSFDDADVLIITDIYPAREKPIDGVSAKLISDAAIKFGHKNVYYADSFDNILEIVKQNQLENDIIITLGAGNICDFAHDIAIQDNQIK